jgi:hypothetical protein
MGSIPGRRNRLFLLHNFQAVSAISFIMIIRVCIRGTNHSATYSGEVNNRVASTPLNVVVVN